MDGSDFFILGGALVAAALVLSAIGIRGSDSFPGSRPLLVGVTALFAAIVAATAALAVVNAREEEEHRAEEEAHEEEAATEEAAAEEGAAAGKGGGAAAQATALDVTSPEDGSTSFEPDALEAAAGPVAIAYSNPSPTPHNIAVEAEDGSVLGETPTFTAGEETLELQEVAPGRYVFFCTVPGHREAGMEGDLDVN